MKKNTKYCTLIDEKKINFLKFVSPYGRVLPNGNIKPFDTEELFCSEEHTFPIHMVKELQ